MFLLLYVLAATPPTPLQDGQIHLGVASCASSTCHGSAQAFRDSNVLQNEFATWQNEDPHHSAYEILLGERAREIAQKLGLGAPEAAAVCLDCHADNVPPARRGERFRLEDGVGCEACHGGAERWLSSHASGQATHAENLAAGMFPTEDPRARAELCLSCHLGNPRQLITHRIMGAGHPRLQFELDNFTAMHAHFSVDADYVERKGEYDGTRDWAVGQGTAARMMLETLIDEDAGWSGIFPELVLFDCHACHESMRQRDWRPHRARGLPPGAVPFNDANLQTYRYIVGALDPTQGPHFEEALRRFHHATAQGPVPTREAAQTLLSLIDRTLPLAAQSGYPPDLLVTIMDQLVAAGERGEYADYLAAEQVALAVESLIFAFEGNGLLTIAEADSLRATAAGLFTATDDEERYDEASFVEALRQVRQAFGG